MMERPLRSGLEGGEQKNQTIPGGQMRPIAAVLVSVGAAIVLWYALSTDSGRPSPKGEEGAIEAALPAEEAEKIRPEQSNPPLDPETITPEQPPRADQEKPPRIKIDPTGGATLAGTVINGNTDLPLDAELAGKATVILRRSLPEELIKKCRLDGSAFFRLTGLAAGTYSIEVESRDFPGATLSGTVVQKGEILDDLRIVIPSFGKLLHPYYTALDTPYKMTLWLEGESEPYFTKQCRYFPNVTSYGYSPNKVTLPLPAGRWTARFSSAAIGAAVRRFEIEPATLFELCLERDDFLDQAGHVSLEGRLLMPDGAPVPGRAVIEFRGLQTEEWGSFDRKVRAMTGFEEQGRFTMDCLRPGDWEIAVWQSPDPDKRKGRRLHTFELTIPQSPVDPFPCDLILPGGKVSGILVDAGNRKPIPSGPVRLIRLEDRWTGAIVTEAVKLCTAPSFEMDHVPAGDYRLVIQAVPYENRTDIEFSLGHGKHLDLGEIALQPAGTIVLRVEGAEGRRLHGLGWRFPDRNDDLTRPISISLEGRRGKAFSIPTPGPVRINLSSGGFRNKSVTVTVHSGVIHDVHVVLEPK